MRKRILCTALLSLLAVWLMPFSALAGTATTTDYYKLLSVKPNVTTFQLTGTYDASQTVNENAVTFTVDAQHRNAETAPSGFNSTATITWSVAVNPADASTGNDALKIDNSTLKADDLAPVGVLKGKISAPCTITVTATQGSISKVASKVKLIPIEKPAPIVSTGDSDKTKKATQLIGMLGALPALGDDNAKYAVSGTTASINPTAGLGAELTFMSYPEYISITPSLTELAKYGIKYTDDGTNGTAFKSGTINATTTRKITFALNGQATDINTPTPAAGVPITVKVWNKKVDGKTDNTALTKTITLRLYAYPPLKLTANNTRDKEVTLPSTAKVFDLGNAAATKKANGVNNHELKGLQMALAGQTFSKTATANAKWDFTDVTTPALFYAKNLPTGLKLVMDNESQKTTKAAKAAVTAYLSGTPEPGYYNNIKIVLSNDGGVWSKDYVMDVVALPEITTTKLPDLTWGQAYTATVEAKGGENNKHPITFDFQTISNKKQIGPGIRFTDAAAGTLSGKLISSDAQLKSETAANASDFMLGTAKEKEVTLKLTVKNDYSDTATKTTHDKNIPLKIKGVAPAFDGTTAIKVQNIINGKELAFDKTVKMEKLITVKGPGTISFDILNSPDCVSYVLEDNSTNKNQKLIEVDVTSPKLTMKDHATTFRIYNGAGELKFPIKFTIGADESQFTVDYDTKLKPAKIGQSVDKVALEAAFGPVKWTAKDLPSGLSLSIDKSVPYDKSVDRWQAEGSDKNRQERSEHLQDYRQERADGL